MIVLALATPELCAQQDRVILNCPVDVPLTGSVTPIPVPVHYTIGSEPVGGFSLGFHYDSDLIEADSVSKIGSNLQSFFFTPSKIDADSNTVLAGYADFSGAMPIPASDSGLAFTIWFSTQGGAGCVDIDSSFIPPAGNFIFSLQIGGSVTPDYVDCDSCDVFLFSPDPPVLADIPGQSIFEGASFAPISLDDFVEDSEFPDAEIAWTSVGNASLQVSIDENRVAIVSAPHPDWFGAETITFVATNPGFASESDTATFTVTGVPDPPVAPDTSVTVDEDSDLVSAFPGYDVDLETLTWQALSAPANGLIAYFDNNSGVFQYEPSDNYFGLDSINYSVSDGFHQPVEGRVSIEVESVNDPPVVENIADQSVLEGDTFLLLDLGDYVTDVESDPSELQWSVAGNSSLNVIIDDNRTASIVVPHADWFGFEAISFIATDPELGMGSDEAIFEVIGVNDPPSIEPIGDQTVRHHRLFEPVALDGYVSDPDGELEGLSWSASGNVQLGLSIDESRVAAVTAPDPDWTGTETIQFTVVDTAGASDVDTVSFSRLENNAPEPPTLVSPISDFLADTLFPLLTIENSLDADDDSLSYTFEVAINSGFFLPLTFQEKAEEGFSTSTRVPQTLQENTRYWWRVRSSDYYLESGYSSIETFYVDAMNELPTSFSLITPESANSEWVRVKRPEFVWSLSEEDDPLDWVSYDLHLALDSAFTFQTVTYDLVDTTYTPAIDLAWGTDYWWKVAANDSRGATRWSSQVLYFRAVTLGDADASGEVNVSDAVFLVNYIFTHGPTPDPAWTGDADCSGAINISDVIYLIQYIFNYGPPPCEPG